MTKSLNDLAADKTLSAKAYMSQADAFLRKSSLEDGETDPNEVVDALVRAQRFDILHDLKKHKVYGERVKESLKIRCSEDGGTYDWITATVDFDGERIRLNYRATELKVDGSDCIEDEYISEWSEDDIRKMSGQTLTVHPDDYKKIKVEYA